MKYSNKIKPSKNFSVTIFFFIFGIAFCIVLGMLYVFPIQMTNQNMQINNKWYAKFVVFWPESPLKLELQERKQIKRYSKVGFQKRLEKQFKNMNILNTTLYDLWLDKNVEIITNTFSSVPDNSSFFWPVLPNEHESLTDEKTNTKHRYSYFVFFPNFERTKIRPGTYLGSGDAVKSNIPISNAKRYLTFEALPLAPGHIKIALGQYIWTRTFTENDVQKSIKFFIPINDSHAQNYKFTSVSTSLYLLDLKIVTKTSNAREPIYLSKTSPVWVGKEKSSSETKNNDPFIETENPHILLDRETTLAKGYNTLVITVDNLNSEILNNQKVFKKLMPELSKFSHKSLVINNNLDAITDPKDRFKLPQIYKRYGYKTALFSDAETVSLQDNITSFNDFNIISKSWLVDADAHLKQSGDKEDVKSELEGLNAIFKQKTIKHMSGLNQKQFASLSEYIHLLSQAVNQPNNLQFDENFLISKTHYIPNLIEIFQIWTTSQAQNRFFADLSLTTDSAVPQLTMQDLWFIFSKKPTLNIKKLKEYVHARVIDREFKQIIDTLQVRHLTHRTLVSVVLKNKKNLESSTALVFIPGLKPRVPIYPSSLTLRDLEQYSLSVVGIQPETSVNFAKDYVNLETQKQIASQVYKPVDEDNYMKYNLIVYPNKNNCTPFIWRATNATITNVNATVPFYQVNNSNTLEFFPCDFGEKILEIEWYQQRTANNKIVSNQKYSKFNHINGYFVSPEKNPGAVEFYYGKHLLNRMNFPLNFQHKPDQMNSIFKVDKKEFDQVRDLAIGSFKVMRQDSKLSQSTQAVLLMSTVFSE